MKTGTQEILDRLKNSVRADKRRLSSQPSQMLPDKKDLRKIESKLLGIRMY